MGRVLPSWRVEFRRWVITIHVTLDGTIDIEPPENVNDVPLWGLLQSMTPDEAHDLSEALALAVSAARELVK